MISYLVENYRFKITSVHPGSSLYGAPQAIIPFSEIDGYSKSELIGYGQHVRPIAGPMWHEPSPPVSMFDRAHEWAIFPEEFQIGSSSYFVPRWQCIGIVALAVGIAVLVY